LVAYGNSQSKQPGELIALNVSSLEGGYTSAAVYKVNLEFRLNGSETRRLPVVLKHTSQSEVDVMRALNDVPGTEALPRLIDHGQIANPSDDNQTDWFVAPFYEGQSLGFDDEVPQVVIESLVRLHAYFMPRNEQLEWMPNFDFDAFRGLVGWVLDRLDEANARQADQRMMKVRQALQMVQESPLIRAAFERLPATLIHGDVHGGNILRLANGSSMLIDWGNARLAPAMFDLANMVDIDSENWQHYLATWEEVTGDVLDEDLARLGYYLATVMVNTQYLPFVVGNWPDNADSPEQALGMVGRLENAVRKIETGCYR